MVEIIVGDKLNRLEHFRNGLFYIPSVILLDNTKYKIITNLEKIDDIPRGGFGLVIFYQHKHKKIAIKFINLTKLENTKGKSNVKKAKKEVEILEELKMKFQNTECKKSIVNYIGNLSFSVKDHRYLMIVLDKMDMDLWDYIIQTQNKKIKLSIIKKIMLQITKSLECLNKNGIVYNDMKPENILINKINTDSRLTDFNCILKLEEEHQEEESKDFTGCSTSVYRSPEQIETAVSYDVKADSWQLGILFMCLLQKNPSSFIGSLSKKNKIDKYELIKNLSDTEIKRQFNVCKDNFIEFKNKDEFDNMQDLIIGLLQNDPKNRWSISNVINSKFLKTKEKTIKQKSKLYKTTLKSL